MNWQKQIKFLVTDFFFFLVKKKNSIFTYLDLGLKQDDIMTMFTTMDLAIQLLIIYGGRYQKCTTGQ